MDFNTNHLWRRQIAAKKASYTDNNRRENNLATSAIQHQEHPATNYSYFYIWPDVFTNSEFYIFIFLI
jgi:hypothetical protein